MENDKKKRYGEYSAGQNGPRGAETWGNSQESRGCEKSAESIQKRQHSYMYSNLQKKNSLGRYTGKNVRKKAGGKNYLMLLYTKIS